ncbi:glucocorticoid receptor-like isoform X2 [Tigriopus californicus]|uniref:glucocorticoid receptor-like isoform X2 n=1 Tax=Tigriopus californicus TaxID=6832 RepID=UPI0027DA5121|nr:glucocorticoid receptor-like isoform X2 [Tigriopus californicus]
MDHKWDLNCVIDSTSRKSCKFCRYQKCLDAGMNPAYVLSPAERKDRILRQYQSKSGTTRILPRLKLQRDLSMVYTQEEELYHKKEYKSFMTTACSKCLDFFVNRLDDYKTYHESIIYNIPLTPEKMKLMMKLDEVIITAHCLELSDGHELSSYDRMTLIKNNFSALYGLVWAGYGQDYCTIEYYTTFLDFTQRRASTDENYRLLANLAEELLPLIIKGAFGNLNGLFPANDLCQELNVGATFKQETSKVQNWSAPYGLDNGPDHNIILIFYKIILFGTDFPDRLDEPTKIEAIRDKYLWQLHRYIKNQSGKKTYTLLHETAMIILSIKSISTVLENAMK